MPMLGIRKITSRDIEAFKGVNLGKCTLCNSTLLINTAGNTEIVSSHSMAVPSPHASEPLPSNKRPMHHN